MRKQEFNSKLISLLPLDEVPVHVPLRRPRPLRFERLRVPVWNPYSRDLNLIEEFKFKLHRRDNLLRLAPQLAATPWGGSPPRPLRQKICYSDCTRNCPLCPLRAPRRFRNPKIGQQLGAQPTPRFRGMLDALLDAMFDPWPPFTFCCPQAIVDQDAGVSIPNSPPFSRSTRFPFTSTASPPAPCDSKGSECQCGIHTAETASALRSRKTERGAKGKTTQSHNFF